MAGQSNPVLSTIRRAWSASWAGFFLAAVLAAIVLLLVWFAAFARGMAESVGTAVPGILTVTAKADTVSASVESGAFLLLLVCGLGGAAIGIALAIRPTRRPAAR